ATHRLTTHRPVSPKAEQTDSDQQQRPAHIYAVSPEILAIEVAAPDVTLGRQIAYQPQPDDEVVNRKKRSHIKRNGQLIGILVGPKQDTLYTYDQVQETSFRADIADLAKHYEISSRNAPHYALAKSPVTLFRKTKPVALSQSSNGARQWPTAHTLYLTLPRAMTHGKTYQLKFSPDLGIENDSFTYQPQTARSEAIHISQLGFRPSDTFKAGYLSTWMGNGGGLDYADNLNFSLIDTHSNQTVYRSRAVRKRGEHQIEDPRDRDYTLSEVHQLDFSSFNQPGEYRLCVEGIGCSFDFEIQADVWDKAFYTSARGFYHQRSGLAIGPPHSEFQRPRAFHPADGLKVYQSNASLLEVDMGLGEADTFETLVANKTEVEVPNAWGGYFDAADWDRRIQHLTVPRHLLELHNLFPEHFQAINLNLPESNNALPDILDEALWSIDFFRRLQLPDGGIRGGVESAAHPKKGEASWQESLTVMAYAPGVWSSYLYAGVAARAATTLKAYDSQLSETYENSALQAMAYAEKNYRAADYIDGKKLHQVSDARNLTSLELYRLTQDTQWHDLFLETTAFSTAAAEVFSHTQHDQADAAFLYARLSPSDPNLPIDQPVQNHARAALLEQADEQVTLTKTSAFGWSRQAPDAPVGWRSGLGAPTGINVLRAHALTQEAHYLQAGISGTQFAAGANPANMVFTTGLGDRTPQNPLISDYRITRQDPPPGITLFGPADFDFYKDYWVIDRIAPVTFPHPSKWPTT
ncbi:MAG: glycoside hydrolase family 9 protein, partial [Cyanobacteria bacterium J06607_13]